MGQEQEGEEDEEEWGKVNGDGSHDEAESGGALGSLGETLGQRTLLEEQRRVHCSEKEIQWGVTALQHVSLHGFSLKSLFILYRG